eukprot:snap_masked-scaffold_4-processed-gene-18.29-mRNA-1 protein AED:0.03 eAED:0.03 QI:103/1/1/1/0/0/2/218/68
MERKISLEFWNQATIDQPLVNVKTIDEEIRGNFMAINNDQSEFLLEIREELIKVNMSKVMWMDVEINS